MQKLLVSAVLGAAIFLQPISYAADSGATPTMPKVGDMAPDFKLQYLDSSGLKDVSLSQYRGKSNVILAFYIFAFTGG